MDLIAATFIVYFGFAAATGVISNFQKPIWISAASATFVGASFLLELFAGPMAIFALFYVAPYLVGRFSWQFIRHITPQTRKEVIA
jgi:hypothetical protein